MSPESADFEYVGFWPRVGASVIDSVLSLLLILPFALAYYGPGYFQDSRFFKGGVGFLIEWILPAVAVIAFWIAKGATPGKMLISARIVDAVSGGAPTKGQLIGRYLGYYVSMIPLFAGFIWVAFDARKQGWHDKLAGTLVVRAARPGMQPDETSKSFRVSATHDPRR